MEEKKEWLPRDRADGKPKDTNTPHAKNWVTDMYDKMNVSVNALNIAIVVLMVFIIGIIVIASQH